MKVVVSGASGLVGSKLVPALTAAGHKVVRLVRDPQKVGAGSALWNPATGQVDAAALADCDAVINLAGESIAAGRWSEKRKRAIIDSRLQATSTLAKAMAALPPKTGRVLINASAIGFYGNRDAEQLEETSSVGSGDFLSGVCQQWEAASQPAAAAGIRVVLERFGIILSAAGGALQKMLTPFKLGVGGVIGSGKQYMSWIDLDDVVAATLHCLATQSISGAVNFVAPGPVTNHQFTKSLGRVLGRPTIFPMPGFAARLAFGQMADELLLASQRVAPTRLIRSGYAFKYPELEGSLRHATSQPA
jgi:uncharacterized protein